MTQPDSKRETAEKNSPGPEQVLAPEAAANAATEAIAQDADAPLNNSMELQSMVEELQGRLLRAQADLENFRRRTDRERDEARKFESLRLVRDLLPGLDGLNRAIASAEQTGDLQTLLNGIRMVTQQFRDVLKAHAAEPIDALGKPFDPNLHEALTQVPSAEHEPMTVLQVVEVGYRLHDRVVRPARVIVSSAPPEAANG
jgi:molecular chaperone GrpE